MAIDQLIEDDTSIKPRKKKADDTEMDITPMIDITFLLLIFFLVASKMDTPASVTLPEARNGGAVGTKNSIVITIMEDGDNSAIYKGEGGNEANRLKAADPVEQETEISSYIESEVQKETTKNAVLIKAESGVKHREVGRVAKAVGKVTAIEQLHVAVLEKK